jgi:Rrf2 family protein
MRNSPTTPPAPTPVLSATAEYALRAVLVLARDRSKGRLSAEEIARATGAPANYHAKTLNALAKSGVVTSARGPAGGFGLAMEPADLTIARIADAFPEPSRPAACLLGSRPCNPDDPCAAHHRWSAITRSIRDALTRTSVADLLPPSPT